MWKRINSTLFFLVVSILTGIAQTHSGRGKAKKSNVLFVMCDQWRRQALGFIGEDPVITPNLDAFSKNAVVFKNTMTVRPICTPSRASFFSGQYPVNTGVYGNGVRMSTRTITMGDVAKKAGYNTGYIGKWHLDGPNEGYVPKDRRHGFDYWIISKGDRPFEQPYFIQDQKERTVVRNSWEPDWVTDRAVEFLQSKKEDPFFLVVSYLTPHNGAGKGYEDRWMPGRRVNNEIRKGGGYAAPERFEALYPDPEGMPRRPNIKPVGRPKDDAWRAFPGYFGAITSIDENFGRLLQQLKDMGEYDNTIIVFTSDHGEMLGSQGRMTKGIWYEEAIGIPFLIAYPSKVKPALHDNIVNSIDIMPTLLGLAGLEIPESVDGFNFTELLLRGKQKDIPQEAYTSFDQGEMTEHDRSWRAIRTDRYLFCLAKVEFYRYIKDGMVLYDLQEDPYQMKPIFRGMGRDREMDELFAKLKAHLDKTNDPFISRQWKTDRASKFNWNNALDRSILADTKYRK